MPLTPHSFRMKIYYYCHFQKFLLLAILNLVLQSTHSQTTDTKVSRFEGITSTSSTSLQPVYLTQLNPFTSHDPNWKMNQRTMQQSRIMTNIRLDKPPINRGVTSLFIVPKPSWII
jgi:hypothetical protein